MKISQWMAFVGMILLVSVMSSPLQAQETEQARKSKPKMEQKQSEKETVKTTEVSKKEVESQPATKPKMKKEDSGIRVGDDASDADPSEGKGKVEKKTKKGNAYGKYKGEKSGREFGQDRAKAAKSKQLEQKEEIKDKKPQKEKGASEKN